MAQTIRKAKELLRKEFVTKQWGKQVSGINNLSLICNNCVGGMVLHDFAWRFDTPTINTWINDEDFIKFCKNLPVYKEAELRQLENSEYVAAQCCDITIHFMHESNPYRAFDDWKRRFARLHTNNIWILFIAKENTESRNLEEFSDLPFEHKCCLSYKEYEGIKNCFTSPTWIARAQKGKTLVDYNTKLSLKRGYDEFDFVKWFQEEGEAKNEGQNGQNN